MKQTPLVVNAVHVANAVHDFTAEFSHLDVQTSIEMKKMTTFGIGGEADVLVRPKVQEEVVAIVAFCKKNALPLFVLGGGSNLLIGDGGIRGVVLKLAGELAEIKISDDKNSIFVGAGASFPALTKVALSLGWESAVGWMGTPGLVGGALKMNAGTKDGCIGDVVHEVMGLSDGNEVIFSLESCGFGYRTSKFPPQLLLTRAHLQCDDCRNDAPDALQTRAKALLKKRHQSQPKMRSAGSIFKNPPGDFAGRLIEAAGLKGMKKGDAQISDVHANFIVNLGKATAAEVDALASHCQAEVLTRFGVQLEWEVRRIGEFL